MTLFRRSLQSITWTIPANIIHLLLFLGRSILLTRWLPIEVFGIYAGARAAVGIAGILPNLGMEAAFIHRDETVQNEDHAAAIHFTLKLIITGVWGLFFGIFLLLIPLSTITSIAVITLVLTSAAGHLLQTPNLILRRRVVHRRLAMLNVITSIITVIISIGLGWIALTTKNMQFALWALLCAHVISTIINYIFYYLWQPVWRPRLAWDGKTVKYFLSFGGINLFSNLLLQLLDKVDDSWAKIFIGDAAAGFYTRAYRFATYPREVIARPVNQVFTGTFAELKGNRLQLSQAFFRSTALLIRSGFLLGGVLWLIAPEFVSLILGEEKLPMLRPYRFMLLFTLLDPLKVTVSNLMVSIGSVKHPIPIRLTQLVILLVGLAVLAPKWGIEGVAVAVNIMAIAGIFILFWQVRSYVDYSPIKLFGPPFIALSLSFGLVLLLVKVELIAGITWGSFFGKILAFVLPFSIILFLIERKQLALLINFYLKRIQR